MDIDVTPFDNSKTKKEGVSRTYKGFDGFELIMVYMGTEGYLVNTQLRTVITNLMQFAGHLTEHAGRLVLSIGKSNRWRFTFKRIYDRFACGIW